MNWTFVLALLIGVVLLTLWKRVSSRLDPSAQDEIRQAVTDGAILLDVRTPMEFAQGHLDGAMNIPLDQLVQRQSSLGKKSRAVVVYCRSGARSRLAVSMLQQNGFKRALDLRVMRNWPAVSSSV